jgi:hypothetical protein
VLTSFRHSIKLINEFFFWVGWFVDPERFVGSHELWMRGRNGPWPALSRQSLSGDGRRYTRGESLTKSAAVLNAAERVWECRPVFQGSEVTFRERIVVGGVRTAMSLGDAEIGQ